MSSEVENNVVELRRKVKEIRAEITDYKRKIRKTERELYELNSMRELVHPHNRNSWEEEVKELQQRKTVEDRGLALAKLREEAEVAELHALEQQGPSDPHLQGTQGRLFRDKHDHCKE